MGKASSYTVRIHFMAADFAHRVHVVFSNHRPETLAPATALMRAFDAIVLEEPTLPGFESMLDGSMSIDAYLEQNDFQFPEFERHSCELFRALHAQGKALYQVDPYMAQLDAIHTLFASGGKPADIDPLSALGEIYAMEKRWSAALLANYEHCPIEAFDGVVAQVQQFAREDAARGRLRDKLRADAIAALAPRHHRIYVEAGSLHIYLLSALAQRLPKRPLPVYLLAPVIQRLSRRRRALSPGDQLTLLYTYRPDYRGPRADLLAARNLVHTLLAEKEELVDSADEFPHTRHEVATNALVEQLGYDESKQLYGRILGHPLPEALAIARRYLASR